MRRWFWIPFVFCLAACSAREPEPPAFVGTPIPAGAVDGRFKLVDHHGRLRQLEDFRGKVVTLFFGYTHCPDVCPTTMSDLAKAMRLLGERKSGVQVLFVTLDPERDSQEVLAQYVPAFDPTFLGLIGDPAVVAETARQFGVFYKKQASPGRGRYTIDHGAGIYVFDKRGTLRLYLHYGQKPKDIAHDLALLANE